MITVTYSWWTMSASKGSVTIQTANIATKITLYQGIDYNHDGVMDRGIDESLPKAYQSENIKNKSISAQLSINAIFPDGVEHLKAWYVVLGG